MSTSNMEATTMLPVLKKKLAFLSGGKDRRSGLILTIPLCTEQTSMEELSATLDYLLGIPSEKCKARGFTVIVDGRKSQWNVVKTVVLMLQNVIPAEVSLVCVVKPDEFWDKKVTHFCFWKEKDRLGFEVILVSANKLTRYIEPCQLTEEFGGSLLYDHMDWVNKRLVFEKFTRESTSLLDELAVINENEKSNQPDKDRPPDCNALPSFDPETVLQTGHELLSELQQRRFNGSEGGGGGSGGGGGGGTAWSPMDDELLAQPQVMKLLDSLREEYTKYQEVCRQRSKRSQLEEIQTKVMQVVNWLEGPGTEQLRAQWGIGDSIRASQALQQKHEEIESQHSEWFAVYVELNQQIAALLSAGDEEDLLELKALQQQLSDVCYRQASQLESRQNVLQSAHEFHGTAQDLSQQLDGLLGMLCADVAPADGAAIQQTLKHLEEKLKSVDGALQGLKEKGQVLLDQMSNQASWSYGKEAPLENKENVDHIHSVMEDMQLRKQRCEDMVDVRRLKMLQMVQLFKCEEDASQAVEWLGELLDALLKTHLRLGDDSQETKVLLEKHKKFVDVAQSTYDYGRQLLQATVVLCQSLRCTTRSSGDTLPRLNRVWKQFSVTSEERVHRLEMASSFHTSAENLLKESPEQAELMVLDLESCEEVVVLGKSLLDRLTVPVIFPDGSEHFFGSPGDMASSAESVREKLKLVEEKRFQLEEVEQLQHQEEALETEELES
ncbi:SEC14 domain and spectrin repeat-containing protein 1 [Alosa sapidissima]|uniref:SEC14 domain and spectrin repeat-containing protein 1 n=1 Tax=Alosa sapidissima TaxID=34773 RepID=UPI001C08CA29|nr:SEC14 domain and spectrin repeat-containing protein 1 [Alosa sapidissima]XP_041940076.1 SEC14 domain and spectrin repeat-containing protein 1 [Alosa sapidissima]XP_041940077.1 SEC14 domain and spectrin repeat-containing protein 1 [Alosa sapidissima]XP_041940078.1 SEC14 domain and spectrin repeat-containing protein 1 [Alosa sapidissima]XP_041940079.1 SEC14 domain and spectrin repeat-containing protein 1 [Alosa sapidissima]XP_041940080.1 SEC14 domain and spectrin repeat-containing protein 1 [